MDVFTHALLGVTLSEATLRRRVGPTANWLAALAAMSPDIDTLPSHFNHDPWFLMAVHRGATHALVVAPLLALVATAIFWAFRRRQFWPMYLLAVLAVVSHPLLDLVTSYGTQVLWPFTHARYALDILPIVDLIFTPTLAAAVVAAWFLRRRGRGSSEPGRPRPRQSGVDTQLLPAPSRSPQVIAIFGLLLAAGYVGVGAWVDHRTRELALATVPADRGRVLAVRSGPLIGMTFARRLVVKTEQGFYVARYNLLRTVGDPQWRWAADDDGPFVKLADRLDHIELFRWFSTDMARTAVDPANGNGRRLVRVSYYDMRYGYPADSERSVFAVYVIFDADTKELLDGPTRPRWSGHQETPDGVAAFFNEPASASSRADITQGGVWSRVVTLWQEMWRP